MTERQAGIIGWLACLWGLLGVTAILAFAVFRLGRHMFSAFEYDWSLLQVAACILNVAFMAWSEGYRGFQKGFSPRTVARAMHLIRHPGWFSGLLAPLFCAGYFLAEKRVRMVVWIGTVGIVILVLLVQQTPQPWRGIIDAGVVVGLSWGIVSLWLIAIRSLISGVPPADSRVPEKASLK